MTIEILRGGVTSRTWSGSGWDAAVGTVQPDNLSIRFKIASKGGGTVDVMVKVDNESFAELAQAMMQANSKEAIKAFGAALQNGAD